MRLVTPAVDDLPDWRTHLRARNVAPSTIASLLTVGANLLAWLAGRWSPSGQLTGRRHAPGSRSTAAPEPPAVDGILRTG